MPNPLEPGDPSQIDEYLLAGRLGAGGQGVVYDAYAADGARVAIKVLHVSNSASPHLARMAKEVEAAQRVASFCTAKILHARLDARRPYVVIEFVAGSSLDQVVYEQGRRFTGDDLHRLAIGIGTALTAIHEAGVVHRDLKPGNILLGPDGPRLIDFGLARTVDMTLTAADGFAGTPAYIAPEVFEGHRAGAAADVFAWGAIIYFAVTGNDLFSADSVPEIAHRVRTHHPDLSVLPESMRTLVGAALAKDPLDRPSARAVLAALTRDPADDAYSLMAAGSAEAGLLARREPVDPALGLVAEKAYESLTPADRALVPEVFLRLVQVGDDGQVVTRELPREELFDRQEPAEVEALQRIVTAFQPLLSGPGDTIVLARPAVVRAWPLLRERLENGHDGLPVLHRIRQAARDWHTHGRHLADTLRGRQLDEAVKWIIADRLPVTLNRLEREFLDASTRARARTTRLRRAVTAVLAVSLVVALVAVAVAVRSAQNAEHERDIAISRQVAARAAVLRASRPAEAMLMAAAAWRIAPSYEARSALYDAQVQPFAGQLTGHTGFVGRVAASPASQGGWLAASGGRDATVRLWDLRTKRQLAVMTGHTPGTWVNTVIFHPARPSILISVGTDDSIRWWDVNRRKLVHKVVSGHDFPWDAAISPDGKLLVTVGEDGSIRFWDSLTGKPLGKPLTGPAYGVGALAFSSDGTRLATGGADHRIWLWDVRTRKKIRTLDGHGHIVDQVRFIDHDRRLLSASHDSKAYLWDVSTGKRIVTYAGHIDAVSGITLSSDGTMVITTGYDHTVRLWDLANGRQLRVLTGQNGLASSPTLTADGRRLLTAGTDNTVIIWDLSAEAFQHIAPVTALALTRDGRTLATGGHESRIRLWNVPGHRELPIPRLDAAVHAGQVTTLSFNPSGSLLASAGFGDRVRVWDVRTGAVLAELSLSGGASVNEVAFSPDGTLLATGDYAGRLRVWNVTGYTERFTVTRHTEVINALAFAPDGRTVATAGNDRIVRLTSTGTSAEQARFEMPGSRASSLAFSRDGTRLFTGDDDHLIRVWDIASRRQIAVLRGHSAAVDALAVSPDGRYLASAAWDSTVHLWDAHEHTLLGTFTAHTMDARALAFAADSRTIATGSTDATAMVWNIEPEHAITTICAKTGRDLTSGEWSELIPQIPRRSVCT